MQSSKPTAATKPTAAVSSSTKSSSSSTSKVQLSKPHNQQQGDLSQQPLVVMRQVHIFVSGKVQGVFYRKYTHLTSTKLGLLGWVRNLDDGRVEILAQGPEGKLRELVQWCHGGSPKAKVIAVQDSWCDPSETLGPFEVQRGGGD